MIYIACPYSHPDPVVRAYRVRAATIYAAQLSRAGRPCFSPLSHSAPIVEAGGSEAWQYWLHVGLRVLVPACREMHVLCLPGWTKSQGVKTEIQSHGANWPGVLTYVAPADIKGLEPAPCLTSS